MIGEQGKVIIVNQEYHLLRAIFIARELGLEAYGVREMVARNKDFWLVKVIKPQPTFLGEAIPVLGDGGATDDK